MELKPLLRWGSGKRCLTKLVNNYLPIFNDYHEPFVGPRTIFGYLLKNNIINNNTYLYYVNSDLIYFYNTINENPYEVIKPLRTYSHYKDTYYKIRSLKPNCNIESL